MRVKLKAHMISPNRTRGYTTAYLLHVASLLGINICEQVGVFSPAGAKLIHLRVAEPESQFGNSDLIHVQMNTSEGLVLCF